MQPPFLRTFSLRTLLFTVLGHASLLASTGAQTISPTPSVSFGANSNQTLGNASGSSAEPIGNELNSIIVTGQLNEARSQIVPYLGATKYSIDQAQIQTQSQGENAPFNQVILRAPGVAQDSYGQLHVRDEHANLQFRIDDVLIPEGITGFGQEIDTQLVKMSH